MKSKPKKPATKTPVVNGTARVRRPNQVEQLAGLIRRMEVELALREHVRTTPPQPPAEIVREAFDRAHQAAYATPEPQMVEAAKGALPQAQHTVHRRISELGDCLDLLEAKLGEVLLPEPPTPTNSTGQGAAVPVESSAVSTEHEQAERLERLINRVNGIRGRLQT